MYTEEVLEDLEVQLSEVNFLINEIAKDSRVKLSKEGQWNIESIANCVDNALQITRQTARKNIILEGV